VDLTIKKDQRVISPQKQKPDLKSLLSKVNDDNLHKEIDFGEPEGKEVW
jgi:antitoxin MazE